MVRRAGVTEGALSVGFYTRHTNTSAVGRSANTGRMGPLCIALQLWGVVRWTIVIAHVLSCPRPSVRRVAKHLRSPATVGGLKLTSRSSLSRMSSTSRIAFTTAAVGNGEEMASCTIRRNLSLEGKSSVDSAQRFCKAPRIRPCSSSMWSACVSTASATCPRRSNSGPHNRLYISGPSAFFIIALARSWTSKARVSSSCSRSSSSPFNLSISCSRDARSSSSAAKAASILCPTSCAMSSRTSTNRQVRARRASLLASSHIRGDGVLSFEDIVIEFVEWEVCIYQCLSKLLFSEFELSGLLDIVSSYPVIFFVCGGKRPKPR